MSPNLFSVTIFIVVFREGLEAALIISVLLSLVDQLLRKDPQDSSSRLHADTGSVTHDKLPHDTPAPLDLESNPTTVPPRTVRKLKLQVIFGALVGLAIALSVGAAFIAIWFTQAKNLWSHSEQLWEGIFNLIASLVIFAMGVTMLKMENARTKWRIKLQHAFDGQRQDRGAKTGKWVLFILPMITVLREGLEAVIFVGGVALGDPATSIPIAAIVGIIAGLAFGFTIYQLGSRTTFKVFLVCMTNLLLLIGAGLFSKAIWAFQRNAYARLIGSSSDDAGGTGPGSYDVRGSVWHLNCCGTDTGSWSIFTAVFGWQNSATLGSVLSYVIYWLAVIAVLVYYKFREGRTTFFGRESANGKRRRLRREAQQSSRETVGSATEKHPETEVEL